MTKYELPDEPEVGSWVKDADNDLWENTGSGWFCRTDETISYRWDELLSQYGPLESHVPEVEPKDGDIRYDEQNKVDTDAPAFIVYQNGRWQRYDWDPVQGKFKKWWVVDSDAARSYYHPL